MTIVLTESAATRVKTHLKYRESSGVDTSALQLKGLRLRVKNAGCSGLAYELDYASKINQADKVFESNGVKIIVDKIDLPFVDGIEIDYIEEGLSAAFHFKNPNATEQCGCGESFTVN